ncbi:DUF305 domain-containing protein [Ornithinimicrobium sp. Arc0846-15]|nr:DUF305 domain-containing protein [Ornithinimicrobium laminariae]
MTRGNTSTIMRSRFAPIALAGALAIAVLLFAAWLFNPSTPDNDSVEAGFARDMAEHHAQAVDMSLIMLSESDSDDIGFLTYDIATTQSNQIGRMQSWLIEWDLPLAGDGTRMEWMVQDNGSMAGHHDMSALESADSGYTGMSMANEGTPGESDYRAMPGMATLGEMEKLRNAEGEDAEILYLQLMITHHLAGVDMAQAALDTAADQEVTDLAQAMVNGQESEIYLMWDYLDARDAEPREDLAALGYTDR